MDNPNPEANATEQVANATPVIQQRAKPSADQQDPKALENQNAGAVVDLNIPPISSSEDTSELSTPRVSAISKAEDPFRRSTQRKSNGSRRSSGKKSIPKNGSMQKSGSISKSASIRKSSSIKNNNSVETEATSKIEDPCSFHSQTEENAEEEEEEEISLEWDLFQFHNTVSKVQDLLVELDGELTGLCIKYSIPILLPPPEMDPVKHEDICDVCKSLKESKCKTSTTENKNACKTKKDKDKEKESEKEKEKRELDELCDALLKPDKK